MTKFNVHIYRETRFKFEGIEAETPEEAANLAAEMHSDDCKEWEECNGDNLGALVDVVGDEDNAESVMIDFEPERTRKAAQKLLAACKGILASFHESVTTSESIGQFPALKAVAEAIEEAAGKISPQPEQPPILIEVRGGVVVEVRNVPAGVRYEVKDRDNEGR